MLLGQEKRQVEISRQTGAWGDTPVQPRWELTKPRKLGVVGSSLGMLVQVSCTACPLVGSCSGSVLAMSFPGLGLVESSEGSIGG